MTDADKAGEREGRTHVMSNSQGQLSVVVLCSHELVL